MISTCKLNLGLSGICINLEISVLVWSLKWSNVELGKLLYGRLSYLNWLSSAVNLNPINSAPVSKVANGHFLDTLVECVCTCHGADHVVLAAMPKGPTGLPHNQLGGHPKNRLSCPLAKKYIIILLTSSLFAQIAIISPIGSFVHKKVHSHLKITIELSWQSYSFTWLYRHSLLKGWVLKKEKERINQCRTSERASKQANDWSLDTLSAPAS